MVEEINETLLDEILASFVEPTTDNDMHEVFDQSDLDISHTLIYTLFGKNEATTVLEPTTHDDMCDIINQNFDISDTMISTLFCNNEAAAFLEPSMENDMCKVFSNNDLSAPENLSRDHTISRLDAAASHEPMDSSGFPCSIPSMNDTRRIKTQNCRSGASRRKGGPLNSQYSYHGVRQRVWGKWVAEIRLPNKRGRYWIGSYDTAEEAAHAYDNVARQFYGENARLNLPSRSSIQMPLVDPSSTVCNTQSVKRYHPICPKPSMDLPPEMKLFTVPLTDLCSPSWEALVAVPEKIWSNQVKQM